MRSIALALAVSIVIASLVGCGRGDMAPPAEAPNVGGQAAYAGAPRSQDESITRDRDVVIAEKAYGAKNDAPAPAPPPPPPPGQASAGTSTPKAEPRDAAPSRDFVIYTARFTMAVYQVDQGIAAIEKIARESGGYLSVKKDREITVRVPRRLFEQVVGAVDKVGDVLHRDIMAEDVTDEHVDLEIRIKNSRAMQQQLTALLARANVTEALAIEKELHRVTEELERLEGRMKLLNDKIAFSTITVVFEPRGTTLTTQRPRLPFPWLSGLNLPTLLNLHEDK